MNIPSISSLSYNNNYSINNIGSNISDNVANNMPNGLVKISQPQNNKNLNNNLRNPDLRQIYTPKLAPSTGSLTENFIKSRSSMSPVFKFNEVATKYEMTSLVPINLKQLKKNIDLIL